MLPLQFRSWSLATLRVHPGESCSATTRALPDWAQPSGASNARWRASRRAGCACHARGATRASWPPPPGGGWRSRAGTSARRRLPGRAVIDRAPARDLRGSAARPRPRRPGAGQRRDPRRAGRGPARPGTRPARTPALRRRVVALDHPLPPSLALAGRGARVSLTVGIEETATSTARLEALAVVQCLEVLATTPRRRSDTRREWAARIVRALEWGDRSGADGSGRARR